MSERWHRTKDLAGLPGMPNVERAIRLHGQAKGWVSREAAWGRRRVLEWLESSLPAETQAALRGLRGEGAAGGALVDGGAGAVADARLEILTAFERWGAEHGLALVPAFKAWVALYKETGAGVSAESRAEVPRLAWNTLQRWRLSYRRRGYAGLVPGSGGRKSTLGAELRKSAESLLCANPHHTSARQVRRMLAARFPERETPHIAVIRRWMRRWRAEHAHTLSVVADPDGHRSRYLPAFGEAAGGASGLNALWELDSTRIDVMCADGKRHALIAAIDVWSRRGKALVAPSSHAAAIGALVRRCLIDWGVPGTVRTDEGADYTSRHLRRVFADLGVEHEVLPPYCPQLKPFVERFIGTISRDLFAQLPGFVGHDVADRERLRSRHSFAARRGRERTRLYACDLSPEQLQARIDAWCADVYAREAHSGLGGVSPFERAASWPGKRRAVDERALDPLLAAPAQGGGTRVVNKDGLHVDGGCYIAAALGSWMGARLEVRLDPADYGRVWVFAREGDILRFVCVAEDPLRTGIDREAVAAEARRRWHAANREARRMARELAAATAPEAAMDEVLAAASARAERVVEFPAPRQAHRTDALDAAVAAAEAAGEGAAVARAPNTARHIDLLKRYYLDGGGHA